MPRAAAWLLARSSRARWMRFEARKQACLSGAQDAPHCKSPSTMFGRLLESKLAQAYDILVPGKERLFDGSARAHRSLNMKMEAIYARVSSEQQREARTIARQIAAPIEFAKIRSLEVPTEWGVRRPRL